MFFIRYFFGWPFIPGVFLTGFIIFFIVRRISDRNSVRFIRKRFIHRLSPEARETFFTCTPKSYLSRAKNFFEYAETKQNKIVPIETKDPVENLINKLAHGKITI